MIHLPRLALFSAFISSFALISCGNDTDDTPPLLGLVNASSGRAHELYQYAQTADQAGKSKKACALYKKMADRYPTAHDAAAARFRQAQLQEQLGKPLEAFTAYSDVVNRYQNSGLYSQALARENAIAEDAFAGRIKTGLIFSRNVDYSDMIKILETLRDSAPQSKNAARAQFRIAEIYQQHEKIPLAIKEYKKLVEDWPDDSQAHEAQYRTGMILLEEARKGNQDSGNLDRAREVFDDYLNFFPDKPRTAEVKKQLDLLKNQDVQRSLDVAKFYQRKGDIESARFYYQEVMKKHGSGSLHDQAKAALEKLK